MILRPYQEKALTELRKGYQSGHVRQILAAPTGSGKTEMASALIQSASAKGRKTLFIVERLELVRQAVERFDHIGLTVGIIQGGNTFRLPQEDVVVASIQTLARRLERYGIKAFEDFGLVIIDEAHILHKAHAKLMEAFNAVPTFGLSATPERAAMGKYFSNMVIPATIEELTEQGFLVPFRCYGPSEPDLDKVRIVRGDFHEKDLADTMRQKAVVADVVSTWHRLGECRQTIAFAVDIAHSKDMVDAFLGEGIPAAHIDCHTPEDQRRELIAAFRAGQIRILSSVAVLAVGFDAPEAACCIMARPTMSIALFIQQAGRIIRPWAGKADAILLDHAGNVARHGLPQHYRPAGLDDGDDQRSKAKRKKERTARPCPQCDFMLDPGQRECPNCGWISERANAVQFVDGELVALDGGQALASAVNHGEFLAELVGYADARGFKRGWAFHKYAERFSDKPPSSLWGSAKRNPRTPSGATLRWIKSRQIAFRKAARR